VWSAEDLLSVCLEVDGLFACLDLASGTSVAVTLILLTTSATNCPANNINSQMKDASEWHFI